MMDEILENEPKIEGPEGTKIGATTGTVEQAEKLSSSSKAPTHDASKPLSSNDHYSSSWFERQCSLESQWTVQHNVFKVHGTAAASP
jgi:hypothetical protein